jgi:hypothetical protein
VFRLSVPVVDCLSPKDTAAGIIDSPPFFGVVEHPDEPQSQQRWPATGRIKVAFTADERRTLNNAVSSICAGTPPVTLDVVTAVPTTDQPLSRPYAQNGQAVVILKVRLQVVSTAASVTVSDTVSPTQIAEGALHSITKATSRLRRGTATPAFDLAITCDQSLPPLVQLMLGTRTGTYPRQVELADPTLATAYLRACPNLSATDLPSQGWPKTR